MRNYNLTIKWTISRARDSYGYNVCTLWDNDKKYRCNGGGYDMLGTVFAEWLEVNFMPRIILVCGPQLKEFYGLYKKEDQYWLNGACGLDCIKRIAAAIGLEVNCIYGKRELMAIVVKEKENE